MYIITIETITREIRMKVTRVSSMSGETNTIDLNITQEQIYAHNRGTLAQDAFPQLTSDEREFYISGTTPEEWNSMFGDCDE